MDRPSFPMPTPQQLARTALIIAPGAYTIPKYYFLDSQIMSSPAPALRLLQVCGASEISIEQPSYLPHKINTLNYPYSWPRFMLSLHRSWWSDSFAGIWYQTHITVPAGSDELDFAYEPNREESSGDSGHEPTESLLASRHNSPRVGEGLEALQFAMDDLDIGEKKHDSAVTTEEENEVSMDEEREPGSGDTTVSEECDHSDEGHKSDKD